MFGPLAVVCLTALCAQAATYVVTNTDNGGAGSLRAAIDAANSTGEDDTINFNIPGCESGGCTINGATFSVDAAGKLTIANNPNIANIVLNANGQGRVMVVNGGANLTLTGITLTGGDSLHTVQEPFSGGSGLYNLGGTVTLFRSAVAGNNGVYDSGAPGAGGITNLGNLTLSGSVVSGNGGYNGGVYSAAPALITNSSISGNSGNAVTCDLGGSITINGSSINGNGRAIYNYGTVEVTNTTISGNTATDDTNITNFGSLTLTSTTVRDNAQTIYNFNAQKIPGLRLKIINSLIFHNGFSDTTYVGGIYSDGSDLNEVVVINSTISDNAGLIAGGVWIVAGSLTSINSTITRNTSTGQVVGGLLISGPARGSLRNTIVAENVTLGKNPDVGNFGSLTSKGNNLVQNSASSGVEWLPTDILDQSPRFGPLGNYGGPTQTLPLTNNSPALNAGNNCVTTLNGCGDGNPAVPADGRGAGRVGGVDIGPFELNNSANGGSYRALTTTGFVAVPYSYLLTPESGPFSYSPTAGSLPPGLTLSNSGALADRAEQRTKRSSFAPTAGPYSIIGTPTLGGTYNYTIMATNGTDSFNTDYRTMVFAAPTAAGVSVGGRALDQGRALANAQVLLTDQNGHSSIVLTSAFGYFRFDNLVAGQAYVISVVSKRYQFAPRLIMITGDLTDLILSTD